MQRAVRPEWVVGDAAASAAQGVGGADDDRVADLFGEIHRVLYALHPSLEEISERGINLSRVGQVLIERCIAGWKEIEFEVMRDRRTPYCSRVPFSWRAMARFRPVCPPRVGRIARALRTAWSPLTSPASPPWWWRA